MTLTQPSRSENPSPSYLTPTTRLTTLLVPQFRTLLLVAGPGRKAAGNSEPCALNQPLTVCLHCTLSLGPDSGLRPSLPSVYTQINLAWVSKHSGADPRILLVDGLEPESCCSLGPTPVILQCGCRQSHRPKSGDLHNAC